MASTYSSNLKIELIGTGEQSGVWGTTTNNNFANVFEQAIVGRGTATFPADADLTLTYTDSVASQTARNLYLNAVSSVSLTQTRNLIVPTINKNYVVQNNTTGSQSIVVKTSAGTGITIPNGFSCAVYVDGTNVIQASNFFPNVNANQVNIRNQGDLRLEDTSGGEYVALQAPGTLASSYTLTLPVDDGTNGQALITDGSGNLSWSTAASGDVYGPASATDNAIARFDLTTGKLIQNSSALVDDSGNVLAGAGTVSVPAFSTTGDTNTGIYFPAADTIAFTEGGAEAMRISSSGNLAIGTTSATRRLEISESESTANSNTTFWNATYGGAIIRNTSTTTNTVTGIGFYGGAGSSVSGIGNVYESSTLGALAFYTAGGSSTVPERMRIDSSGNVGIGISSPNQKLDVSFGSSATGYIHAAGTVSDIYIGQNTSTTHIGQTNAAKFLTNQDYPFVVGNIKAQPLAFGTDNTERMRITSAGEVLIGTTTSNSFKFKVSDGGGAEFAFAPNDSGVNSLVNYNRSTSAYFPFQINSLDTRFLTSGTERMRITSGGALYVGATTESISGSNRVEVVGTNGIGIKSTGSAGNSPLLAWNAATTGDNIFINFYTESSITSRGSIDYNRGAGLVRYNTTSDATLKNIIGDSDRQKSIEILNTTRIREFAWKEDAEQKPQIGVIAQELYETYKGAVSVGGEDAEGNYRPWGVDKTAFTFHLIAGWQEHQKIIQEQQQIINDLKARIETLESK